VHYDHNPTAEQAQRDEALLAIVMPVVFHRGGQASEDFGDTGEVDPVLLDIRPAFGFIPFECHDTM
jgi:hypothetical protein